ncbi:MAG: pyridoxal-dependent decarboxylase [Acidobacteriota bacterium]|jgi:glutamate/tyrosine decarboxylase-like PLP-dependent enzyme
MSDQGALPPEETLDPQDWNGMRDLGHRMVDTMIDYLRTVRDRPVWRPIPPDVKARFRTAAPRRPEGPEQAWEDFRELVLPHPLGNIHPRFWGWVIGTGTPLGMLAEMLAAGMNSNAGGYDQGSTQVETQVIEWCKEMLGYPSAASGLLVSGGSVANLVGILVGRNHAAGFDVRVDGVRGFDVEPVVYASEEVHSSNEKAVEIAGLGGRSLRRIPVDRAYRIDVPALEAAIARDREEGRRPLMIVGTAGTVNTGAFDDLEALARISRREGMWLHVDGAFGALAALDPELRALTHGMEMADSLAFDLHKWMYVPYEAGCTLVRDPEVHRRAFSLIPSYLARVDRGLAVGVGSYSEYGPELSRGFKALKVWMSIKEHGLDRYARLIRQNVEQARYLAARVEAADDLELLAPVPLNVVCFRYTGGDGADLDTLNREIVLDLHERGIAVPSYTVLRDRFAIRVAITNHRSRRDDFDRLLDDVRRLGRERAAA